jgi:hypothetical protein
VDITRYHVFLVGVVLLLLGGELRLIDSVVLTPKATRFLAEQAGHPAVVASTTLLTVAGTEPQLPSKVIRPPEWVSWFLLSLGSVFVLQSWAMAKPS